MHKWMNLALKIAPTAIHRQHKMCALVVRSSKVLSRAVNISRPYGAHNGGRHAEARALRPNIDCNGATLYIVRVGSSMSRPCDNCWQLIRDAGIRRVVYFNWESEMIIENVS